MGSIAIRTWCFALLMGLFLPFIAAHAQPETAPQKEISAQLATLHGQADRAVLYIRPPHLPLASPWRLGEADLPDITCKYEIGGQYVDELLTALENGEITVQRGPVRPVNVRIGVYLFRGDQELATLIFGEPFTDEGMRGFYNKDIPVISGLSLRSELYELARKHPIISKRYDCEKGDAIR